MFFCINLTELQALETRKLDMFDKTRGRNVPVVIYQGETINKSVGHRQVKF